MRTRNEADEAVNFADANACLDDTAVTLLYGDDALLARPVSDEWAAAAREAGWIILSAGVDGFVMNTTGGNDRLDRYLTRPKTDLARPDPTRDELPSPRVATAT